MANNAKDVLADHAAVETSVVRPARSLIEIDLDPRLRSRQELQHAGQSTQYGRRKSDCRYGRLFSRVRDKQGGYDQQNE